MKITFTLIVALVCIIGYGQSPYTLPKVTPKSPNVAGFDRYGEIPVSLSAGLPNISIPLTDIEVGGLIIPLELTYHNTGLRVEEFASMIGLGWDLQVGGVISYQQRGINDFNQQFNGLQYSYTPLRNFINNTMTTQQRYDFLESVINEEQDSEFDVYNMSFMGHSGTFFFDTTGKAVIAPKSDLKVYKIDPGLKIIDNAGNEYYFQTAESATSYDAGTLYILPTFSDVSAWHLSKIITSSGRTIRFTYKSYTLHYSKTIQVLTHYAYYSSACATNSNDFSTNLVTQTFLLPDSIVYDNGFVKFLESTTARQDIILYPSQDSIPSCTGFFIQNNRGQRVKQFQFNQGYFGTNMRLKLSSVKEIAGNEVARSWSFNYYDENGSYPYIFSYSKDHWGYYNGKNNTTLIPEADYESMIYRWGNMIPSYADRSSDFNYAKMGLLQTIKYPTGGTSMFEYEPNQLRVQQYSDIVQHPFLFWHSLPTNRQYITSQATNITGSTADTFVISQPTMVHVSAFIENDPSALASPRIDLTGPQEGLSKLYQVVDGNCNTNFCLGVDEFILEPGTYTATLTTGYDYNAGRDLHCSFEIYTNVLDSGALPPYVIGGCRIRSIVSNDPVNGVRSSSRKFIYNDSLTQVVFRNIPFYFTNHAFSTNNGALGCSNCSEEYKVHSESVKPFAGSTIEYKYVTEFIDTAGTGGKIEHEFLTSTDDGGNLAQPYMAPMVSTWRSGQPLLQKIYKYQNGTYQLTQENSFGYFYGAKENITNSIRVDYASFCLINSPATRQHRTGMSTLFTELFYPNQKVTNEYLNNVINNSVVSAATSPKHSQITRVEKATSDGQSVIEKTIYSFDYDTTTVSSDEAIAIRNLQRKNILVPIEQVLIRKINGVEHVIGSTLYEYKPDKPVVLRIYSLKITSPLSASSFTTSTITGTGGFNKDSRYLSRIINTSFDQYNNIVEHSKVWDTHTSYVWDYKKQFPVATVTNADSSNIAYTSFESDGTGNWNISSAARITSDSITGHQCYEAGNSVQKTGLTTSTEYSLTYWTKNSGPFTISGTQGTPQLLRSANGWKCYEHIISGVTSVTISSSGLIDELRLAPRYSLMTTYCYDPFIGVTDETDANNHIRHYEYDPFGRVKLIRDENRNILKKFDYRYEVKE